MSDENVNWEINEKGQYYLNCMYNEFVSNMAVNNNKDDKRAHISHKWDGHYVVLNTKKSNH